MLCDVQMTPMNGMDLLKELRCGHTMNPSNLPFVFLSGHADRSNVVLASQLHADGFVVKPPKPADVEKAIVAAMQRKRPEIDPFSYYGVATGSEYDRKVFGRLFDAPALPEAPPGTAVSLLAVKAGSVLARTCAASMAICYCRAARRFPPTRSRCYAISAIVTA